MIPMKKALAFALSLFLIFSCASPLCPAASASGFVSLYTLYSSLMEKATSLKLTEKHISLSGVKVYAHKSFPMKDEIPAFADANADESGMVFLGNLEELVSEPQIQVLDISPDGNIRLIYCQDAGYLLLNEREKRMVLISPSAERSVEDQYGAFERVSRLILQRGLVTAEGLAWSPDGRYAAYTSQKNVVVNAYKYFQLFLLDTWTGEFFLAETWPTEFMTGAAVCAACFDKTGENLYYIRLGGAAEASRTNLYSYNLETGKSTFLSSCNNHYPYTSGLLRTQDDSLISVNIPIKGNEHFTLDTHIEFMGSRWMRSMPMHAERSFRLTQFDYSDETGRGFAVCSLDSPVSLGTSDERTVISNFSFLDLFSLNAVDETVVLIPSRANTAVRMTYNELYESITSVKDAEQLIKEQKLLITNAAMSPDGRSALLVVRDSFPENASEPFSLKLLDLETLAIQNVAAPENANLMTAGYDLPLNTRFPAGLRWYENGEIVMNTGAKETKLFELNY